ncbi:MAG: FAD-dependent oxidoreductase [Rhodoferax sp.]
MKIAVIGAGIIGITTAYELACDGHEVTVLEKTGAAAESASFANAGLVAPSGTLPLSMPVWPATSALHFLRSLGQVTWKHKISSQDMRWLWKWSQAGKSDAFVLNRDCLQQLYAYSQDRMHQIAATAQLEYERSTGQLLLIHSEAAHKTLQPHLAALKEAGVAFQEMQPADAKKIEPALHVAETLRSVIHFPNDEVGNCRQYALLLKNAAQKMGVQFAFNTTVTRIETTPTLVVSIHGDPTARAFDSIVVCTGGPSHPMLAPLKIRLPVASVSGYSLSASIREPLNAPRSAVMDLTSGIVIARLGNRIRVSGGAELGGNPATHDPKMVQSLYKALQSHFPGAAHFPSGTQIWKGARSVTFDGLPVMGASEIPGVWLNLGHGPNGWGLSSGAARVLADLIAKKSPVIDTERLRADRRPS